MFAPLPNPQELAFWGLTPEDVVAQNQVEVWADNWQAVELFGQMRTQWRVGFGGIVGLDYLFLNFLMDWRKIPHEEREELLNKIRVMEYAALDIFREKKG